MASLTKHPCQRYLLTGRLVNHDGILRSVNVVGGEGIEPPSIPCKRIVLPLYEPPVKQDAHCFIFAKYFLIAVGILMVGDVGAAPTTSCM